jgi:hypothetical protein
MSEPFRTSTTLYEGFRTASSTNIVVRQVHRTRDVWLGIVGILLVWVIVLEVAVLVSGFSR